jgi:Uri superfamily endonuclease
LKGVYVLIIQLTRDTEIEVGALGRLYFSSGFYAYVGSAQKNLEKRLERYTRREKKKFWHIDYFLSHSDTKIVGFLVSEAQKEQECQTASDIAKVGKAIEGFGCSDCKCSSHLIKIDNAELQEQLGEGFSPYNPH